MQPVVEALGEDVVQVDDVVAVQVGQEDAPQRVERTIGGRAPVPEPRIPRLPQHAGSGVDDLVAVAHEHGRGDAAPVGSRPHRRTA